MHQVSFTEVQFEVISLFIRYIKTEIFHFIYTYLSFGGYMSMIIYRLLCLPTTKPYSMKNQPVKKTSVNCATLKSTGRRPIIFVRVHYFLFSKFQSLHFFSLLCRGIACRAEHKSCCTLVAHLRYRNNDYQFHGAIYSPAMNRLTHDSIEIKHTCASLCVPMCDRE